jgi:hypothetical protein
MALAGRKVMLLEDRCIVREGTINYQHMSIKEGREKGG